MRFLMILQGKNAEGLTNSDYWTYEAIHEKLFNMSHADLREYTSKASPQLHLSLLPSFNYV